MSSLNETTEEPGKAYGATSEPDAQKSSSEEKPQKKRRGRKPAEVPRDDVIVTARVPRGIKTQGDAVLRELNATPTDLINVAYSYVLVHHELPRTTPTAEELRGKRRVPTAEQLDRLRAWLADTALVDPKEQGDGATWGRLNESRGE